MPVSFASPLFPLHHCCHGALSDLPAHLASTHHPKLAPFSSHRSLPLISWACFGISSLVIMIGWMYISLTSHQPINDCPLVHILQFMNTSELVTSTCTLFLKIFFFFVLLLTATCHLYPVRFSDPSDLRNPYPNPEIPLPWGWV
jgi:hypothetical protein